MTSTSTNEVVEYHHNFNDEELEMMLFQWDELAFPVKEYNYMKDEWKTPEMAIINGKKPTKTFAPKGIARSEYHDTGYRTFVDLNKEAPKDEEPVTLELRTWEAVHVVEFYQPWCGHCRASKPQYIELAREVTRRSIAIPIEFHAVSCQLYREVCRAYDISGFPTIYGWSIKMNIQQKGIELNPPGTPLTAEGLADLLGLQLAHEKIDIIPKNTTTLEQQIARGKQVAAERKLRLEYTSSLNDRYHNAAVSLAFILKTSVFVKNSNQLDDNRALALTEFLQLVNWATPESWTIRATMIEEILAKMMNILENGGPRLLSSIVDHHQSTSTKNGERWGDVEKQRSSGNTLGLGVDVPHLDRSYDDNSFGNNRWSKACTYNERGMGFTCGLWDLFHIISIGASIPSHRMFAFRSGYIVEPKRVAEVLQRFISHFFSCNVCRWNFNDMYERCGHNHCTRLIDNMPELEISLSPEQQQEKGRELAIWLWEVHNSVSVRLMREAATRENREVTPQERLSAVFPSIGQCRSCWLKDDLSEYDPDEIFSFLRQWYWPQRERHDKRFESILKRKLENTRVVASVTKHWENYWFVIGPLGIALAFILRKTLESKANSQRKSV
jgi:thiol-disulfide isomerase/thioredoxin